MESTFLCVVCGSEFVPDRFTQRFCSKKCRNREDKNDRRFSGIREFVIRRDDSKCTKCGSPNQLIVHHKDWIRTNNDLENLITLCRSCHFKEHPQIVSYKETRICKICGGEFHPLVTHFDSQILCRREGCAKKYKVIKKRSQHEERPCIVCGKSFMQKHSRHFCCSDECTAINNDRKKAERYALNREVLIEKQKRYYREHKEDRIAYIKQWQTENSEKVKAYKEKNALKRSHG